MREPLHDAGATPRSRVLPAAVALAVLFFYVATLAPGLLWGDPAKFQRMAWDRELRFDEAGHPLWVLLLHPMARAGLLDPALACNLSSAVLSSLALLPAFGIMRRLGASDTAAGIACLALSVSHTYWFHAVVAEVYALNSLAMLLALYAATRALVPDGAPPGKAALIGAGLLAGLASGNHGLVLLWMPGLAWLAWRACRSGRLAATDLAGAAGAFAVGVAPFVVGRLTLDRGTPLVSAVSRLTRQMILPVDPAGDAAHWAGFLLYQFPLPVMLAALVLGVRRLRRERPDCLGGLLILYACSAGFAFGYQVKDRFAFYLPSYLVVALTAAPGLDRLMGRLGGKAGGRAAAILAGLLCVVASPIIYGVAASRAGALMRPTGLSARTLPGRDAASYFLYPGKAGEAGARLFASAVFAILPPRSVLIADHTLAAPLDYVQVVESRRPDVEIYYLSPARQVEACLAAAAQGREVFIAATDSYYDVEGLRERFEISPVGPLHRLIPR